MTNTKECSTYSGLFTSLSRNVGHAIQPSVWSLIGVATQSAVPVLGQVTYPMAVVSLLIAMGARFDETSKLLNDPDKIAHHNHQIMADYMVTGSIVGFSMAAAYFAPAASLYVVGTFFGVEVVTHGNDSPIDNLKELIANSFDSILGGSSSTLTHE